MSDHSAVFCDHANEVPLSCRCSPECYCRTKGTCRTGWNVLSGTADASEIEKTIASAVAWWEIRLQWSTGSHHHEHTCRFDAEPMETPIQALKRAALKANVYLDSCHTIELHFRSRPKR